MSKGTKVIAIRLPAGLEEDMEMAIESRNEWTKQEPWTRTAFILAAIRDKIDHAVRSRRKKKPRSIEGVELAQELDRLIAGR